MNAKEKAIKWLEKETGCRLTYYKGDIDVALDIAIKEAKKEVLRNNIGDDLKMKKIEFVKRLL